MSDKELIYSFDLGSGSLGICVREGSNIKYLDSLLIDSEYASIKDVANRRRQIRTRLAHKARESWWIQQAQSAGIEVLSTKQPNKNNPTDKADVKMLKQFDKNDNQTIYSSLLLRIALLQGKKLEGWQIFKAVWSAMQRRGYEKVPWANDSDAEKNSEAVTEYEKKLENLFGDKKEYYYPCYYEAYIQGIWSPREPNNFSKKLSNNPEPVRNKDKEDMIIPNRELVYKELKDLLTQAAKQYPKLKDKEDFIIYGPSEEKNASYNNSKYKKYRGTNWDWQGLLGQKIPRFDNRIISKCKLIPRLNVCKANKKLNKEVTFLLMLKNMRFTKDGVTSCSLNHEQIRELFETYKDNFSTKESRTNKALINSKKWKNYLEKIGAEANPNQKDIPQPKFGGRSKFCKPTLNILHSLILSGKNPHDYYKELISNNTNTDSQKGLIKDDYKFLLNMPNDWNSISIQDTREEDKNLNEEERLYKIDRIISATQNRIARHRLLVLFEYLQKLKKQYGKPEKIVFEIAREDFAGEEKRKEYIDTQKKNTENIEQAVKLLKDADMPLNSRNILKVRLLLEQKYKDVYLSANDKDKFYDVYELKNNLSIKEIDNYEIDHIVPRSRGGSDSFSNFVITTKINNQSKKERTPYEWFHQDKSKEAWDTYIKNIENIEKISNHKIKLLISDKAIELENKKTDLQATSQIEKEAQTIASLLFGWGINTKGDKKKILFFTGGNTADVRKNLNLNRLLHPALSDEEYNELKKKKDFKEKNRKNTKHHALDALVLSVLPEITMDKKAIESKPDFFNIKFCEEQLKKVYPITIKQIKPKLRETIYSLKCRIENGKKIYYFVSKFGADISIFKHLSDAKKQVKNIFSLQIQKDFNDKLNDKKLTQEKWEKFLETYTLNGKKIKKVSMIDTASLKGFKEEDVFDKKGNLKQSILGYGNNGVKGQWVRTNEKHQGQIAFKENNKWKIVPIYVFESKYLKLKQYKEKYNDILFFKTGDLIELTKNYDEVKAGIYKLRTIEHSGNTKLTSLDTYDDKRKPLSFFIEKCGMKLYNK